MNKLLVFDFDDTIIKSRNDRAQRLINAIHSFGYKPDFDKLESVWGQSFREVVLRLCPLVSNNFDDFVIHYANELKMYPPTICPGVSEAIPILRRRHRLFIHTASHGLLARTDLQTLEMLQYFDLVIGSDWPMSISKPNKRSAITFAAIIRSMRIDNKETLYIGDSLSDFEIATNAGMNFAGVEYSAESNSKFPQGTKVIRDMRELL